MDQELDLQTSISSIDIDYQGRNLVVGGREILKIIDLDQMHKKMNIKQNLRRQGTKLAIGYVEFNRKKPTLLLAASVQGQFQVWDIDKQKETVYRNHQAAIHRMTWHNENCFISGGQDYAINYYDYRQPVAQPIFTLQRNEAIRDIKFNITRDNYFMAASETGQLEYFDIRKQQENVTEINLRGRKQDPFTNLIICLDWTKDNVLASGSNDKEIKILQVENHTDIKEKEVIQHIDGSSHIKWHVQNNSLLSVSSLNRDISVTTYDIRTPFRPMHIIKGHNDIITSFVFNQDEQYVFTGSKDKYLRMQSVRQAYQVYNNCPIFPVAFNQYNDLLMKLESPFQNQNESDKINHYNMNLQLNQKQSSNEDFNLYKSKTQNTSQNNLIQNSLQDIQKATSGTPQNSQSQKNNVRSIFYIEAIDQRFDPKIPFDEELKYFQKNYNSKKDFSYNSNIALQIDKPEIAHYWKALEHLVNDFKKLSVECGPNISMLNCPIQISNKGNDQSDDDQKSPLEQMTQVTKNNKQHEIKQLDSQDLQKLYKYFEKYPAAFRQELDSKNIVIEDQNHLKIHIERIPYYKNLLRTMTPIGYLLTDKKHMMQVISNSILQLIQHVIDQGDLPSGFWMAACAKNYVQFPDLIAKKWTQSYIELLVAFGKHTLAMKAALESPVEQFRTSNKYVTNDKCLGPCKNSQITGAFCNICKTDFICVICFKPVRGLYLWCQQCMHGGHMKEMKNWFSNNTQCPSGCGHNCFDK
ncbi:unnamed protein product [Paramecium pentaurelia]|uniref:WDR59/RTC1-like RING zinc finger domain-containing protein n=1 Tax=Paramecium pentaurelia TaxID=43138 RepID=A0A8S1SZ11_9CILI|nr:unnamed protein product [Paramecium pentaurelia]